MYFRLVYPDSWTFFCPDSIRSSVVVAVIVLFYLIFYIFIQSWFLKINIIKFLKYFITHIPIKFKNGSVLFCKKIFLKNINSATLFQKWLLCYPYNKISSVPLWHTVFGKGVILYPEYWKKKNFHFEYDL